MDINLRQKLRRSTSFAFRVILMCVVPAMSCTNKSDRSQVATENDSPNAGNLDVSLLQGSWWREDTDSVPVFEIRGDSLYYTDEQHAPYFVSIRDNTFELTREDVGMSFSIKKLTADSLIFNDQTLGEEVKFFRKD
jgi:hypothetical protein